MPSGEEADDPHCQHAEVSVNLRAVPQVPGLEAEHPGPYDDHDLLNLPLEPEADDAYREPDGVPDGLLELPYLSGVVDGEVLAYRSYC